jgi:hypothetical protein
LQYGYLTGSTAQSGRMMAYPDRHSISEKRFLGAVVPAQTPGAANPEASLKVALDTLSNHPNVGPFIGKQLIQRLVTSNPSPAYVKRVADTFDASGGSMQAMVAAILLDPEARDMSVVTATGTDNYFGKIREPILRIAALFRAFGAKSTSGDFLMGDTDGVFGQTPMKSPSVFNFFRPGFALPGSKMATDGRVAPEMQILSESTHTMYVNYLYYFLANGFGQMGYDNKAAKRDILFDFNSGLPVANSPLLLSADQPAVLVSDINDRLMYGGMSAELKTKIVNAISTIDDRTGTAPTEAQKYQTFSKRVAAALLLTMVSPEFIVQK